MIKLENVSKKYGEFYAVKKLNFEIKEGEIIGLLGRNGAGKSTTMNMITGFIEATEGKIIIGGYDIDKKPKKAKELIGYMPEGVPLYTDLTVKEFVSYMADLRLVKRSAKKDAVEKAINDTGLNKVQNKLIKFLSRGYKQRVSLAGALVGDPKILILDEPTVGLDPEQVVEIRELIKSLGKNHTVILSSHILSEVSQICEKVIIIDKGQILAVDTPKNLEKNTDKNEDKQFTVIVEDPNDNFKDMKSKIPEIKEMILKETLEDQNKKYALLVESGKDIRKALFSECAKNDIILLETKIEEKTLEDAFMKLVEDRPELSQKEREEIDKKLELEELREESEEKKRQKAEKKKEKELKKQTKIEENDNSKVEDNKSEDIIGEFSEDIKTEENIASKEEVTTENIDSEVQEKNDIEISDEEDKKTENNQIEKENNEGGEDK